MQVVSLKLKSGPEGQLRMEIRSSRYPKIQVYEV